jgi:type I restriction enzyme S subunit
MLSKMQIQNRKYKQTEIGEIPEEWNILPLKNLISNIQSGIWGEEPDNSNNIYPILRSTDILHKGDIVIETAALRKIPEEKVSRYQLNYGDILIVSSSGSPHLLGRTAFFTNQKKDKILFSNFLIRVVSNTSITPKYLYYLLNSHYYQQFLVKIQETTSGLRNLSKSNLIENLYPIPPLNEQQKIASILSNVDNVIQKTDRVIEQTQRLKKGLMQRLLTKGIRHTKFKITKLGEIPEEWDLQKLNSLCRTINDGTHFTPKYISDGIPFLRITDIQQSDIDWSKTKRISLEEHKELTKRCKPELGDVLLSKNGTIGITKIVNWKNPFSIFVSLCLIKPIHEKLNNHYLKYILPSELCLNQIRKRSKQGTITNLHLEEIRDFLIPLPPIKEQQKIASILSIVDDLIQKLQDKKKSEETLKKGLMQQLLTGKIRVRV